MPQPEDDEHHVTRPPRLSGRPVRARADEIDAVDLPVEGVLPPELDGRYVRNGPNPLPGTDPGHWFAITEHHVVWLDLPMVFSAERLGHERPFAWDESYGARLGVMRVDDPASRVQWFEIDPCYVFHVGTAHEDGAGRIVLDGARYGAADAAALWGGVLAGSARPSTTPAAAATGVARMHRWTLDSASGAVTETPIADRPVEFPTLDDALTGRDARYRYAVSSSSRENAIVKLDVTTGASAAYELGPDVAAGEAVFVPADAGSGSRREDDGWLLTITTRDPGQHADRDSASQLLVLDAADVTRQLAAVTLPRGVPAGFHGFWVASPREH